MCTEAGNIQARLQAWREQGADRADPPRFALMQALAQRAERFDGSVRQRLDARLQQLADAYAAQLASPPPAAKPQPQVMESPMQQLLLQFGDAPRADALASTPTTIAAREGGEAGVDSDIAPLPVLDEFQQLWTRIRIDGLLRHCLEGLPEDAGPLHSSVLTYRAMALMREVSPEYLQHFVAYTDALSWLEQLHGSSNESTPASPTRKPARRKKQAR